MASTYGVGAYQQMNQSWNNEIKNQETKKTDAKNTTSTSASKSDNNVTKSTWKPIDTTSSLVPKQTAGIGMTVGDVALSDKAKDYLGKLKSKFGNMEFITVSKDMKEQVKANAASYGNANKMVVLIDEEKLERMATDESYRKKYEGIIAMSQMKLQNAKNSLASSGANVKNFGMSVKEDGTTSFFATLEKSSDAQAKRIEKQKEKKAEAAKSKKRAAKKAAEKKLEEKRAEKAVEKKAEGKKNEADFDEKEYVRIEADSIEALMDKVSQYAYSSSESSVMTDEEQSVGQFVDFKG